MNKAKLWIIAAAVVSALLWWGLVLLVLEVA